LALTIVAFFLFVISLTMMYASIIMPIFVVSILIIVLTTTIAAPIIIIMDRKGEVTDVMIIRMIVIIVITVIIIIRAAIIDLNGSPDPWGVVMIIINLHHSVVAFSHELTVSSTSGTTTSFVHHVLSF